MDRRRRHACTWPIGLLLAMGLGERVRAAPEAPLPGAVLRGQATMRFFGLAIYDARLWTEAGFDPERYTNHAFALELVYARALRGAEIAERSLVEMRRVDAFDEARESAWRTLMQRAFPDVVKGDRLVGLHDGAGAVRFLRNDVPTASAQDTDFARLFFGIWLSPKTSEPALRRALIAAP